MTRERTTRVGRPRGGMKVAARSGERLRRERGRGRLWPFRGFPLAPYLVSFPCFLLVSLQHPLVSSGNPGETPWNSSFWGGSEPCLRLFWGQNRQNTGYFAGIPGNPRYTWKIPGYRADFLNFAPDFAPDQLSDSGKLASFPRETREKQNGAPNTLWFPWKLPETQSAGDPLVSLWVAGNPRTGQEVAAAERCQRRPPLSGLEGRPAGRASALPTTCSRLAF